MLQLPACAAGARRPGARGVEEGDEERGEEQRGRVGERVARGGRQGEQGPGQPLP